MRAVSIRRRKMPKGLVRAKPVTKTTPALAFRDLPKLTPKQQAFVHAIADGMSQAAAYRKAYDTKRTTQPSIYVDASKIASKPSVRLWLDWVRAEQASQAACTLGSHLHSLAEIRDEARAVEQYGPAVAAEKTRGQAAGLHNHTKRVISADISTLYAAVTGAQGAQAGVEIEDDDAEDGLLIDVNAQPAIE